MKNSLCVIWTFLLLFYKFHLCAQQLCHLNHEKDILRTCSFIWRSYREKENERDLLSPGSLPKWPQWSELARSFIWDSQVYVNCFSRCTSREQDHKATRHKPAAMWYVCYATTSDPKTHLLIKLTRSHLHFLDIYIHIFPDIWEIFSNYFTE